MARRQPKFTRLQKLGELSHINPREDKVLRAVMPDSHGEVIKRGLLAEMGRRGDDRLTNLTNDEAALLKSLGGSGTINPMSGRPEYYGDSPGTSGGGGGEGGDNGVGGPGNGSAGTGPGQGPGPGDSGYGGGGYSGGFGLSDMGFGGYGGYSSGLGNFGGPSTSGPTGSMSFGSSTGDFGSMSSLADHAGYGIGGGYSLGASPSLGQIGPNPGNWSGRADDLSIVGSWHLGDLGPTLSGYKEKGTWGRLAQELWSPSTPYSAFAAQDPGRWGAPNAIGPGIMGTAVAQLAGGPMSAAMSVGAAMGRAGGTTVGPDGKNSGGLDYNTSDGLGSERPGTSSNSGLLSENTKPGEGRSEVPTIDDTGTSSNYGIGSLTKDNKSSTGDAMPQIIQNALADYIWRGRNGAGFGTW